MVYEIDMLIKTSFIYFYIIIIDITFCICIACLRKRAGESVVNQFLNRSYPKEESYFHTD